MQVTCLLYPNCTTSNANVKYIMWAAAAPCALRYSQSARPPPGVIVAPKIFGRTYHELQTTYKKMPNRHGNRFGMVTIFYAATASDSDSDSDSDSGLASRIKSAARCAAPAAAIISDESDFRVLHQDAK